MQQDDLGVAVETLVLVMTDVEGSTRLWQNEPAAMDRGMERHHAIVHAAIVEHGGFRPPDQGEGDAVFAAFNSATSAVVAAAQVQTSLASEPWPTSVPLRVRIGVHVGEVRERGGNLYGDPVNRCARLRDLGSGGQTLLSAPVYELVRDKLPAGVSVRDLRAHRMKDLVRPEHVWQLDIEGLQAEFPPLSSLERVLHNLPVQRSPLIGRERDLARVLAGLQEHRLVTLTGFGGMGKTRLALQAAAELADREEDGVWFVDLSSTTDPAAVPGAVGLTTGLGGSDAASVIDGMSGQRLLLVLDNLEQVTGCALFVAELLDRLPGVKILATSREPLRLSGERELPLAPLAVPSADGPQEIEALTAFAAVRMFMDCAVSARPDFVVTNHNAPAVAAICQSLDGHPLAIELAAARVKMMSPQALLPRLDSALAVLTGGRRDMPARHQTLRATIAWSYDLLQPVERLLLDRLSVFAGPVAFEHVEAVCGEDVDVFSSLASLVDQSLVRVTSSDDSEDRYGLLASIRAFAAEQLAARRSRTLLRDRHAAHTTAKVALQPPYDVPELLARRERVRTLYDELALAWSHVQPTGDETALQAFPAIWFEEVFVRTQDSSGLDALLAASHRPTRALVEALAERTLQQRLVTGSVSQELVDRLLSVAAAIGAPEARIHALCHIYPDDLSPEQRRDWVARIDQQLALVPPDSPWSRAHLHALRDGEVGVLLQFVDPHRAFESALNEQSSELAGVRATRNLAMAQTMLGRWQDVLDTTMPLMAAGVARVNFSDAHAAVAAGARAMVQLGRAQEALEVLDPWTAEAERRGWSVPREVSAFSTALALCELGRPGDATAMFTHLPKPYAFPATMLLQLRVSRLSRGDAQPSPAQELADVLRPRAWGQLTNYLSALVELALRTQASEGRRAVLAEINTFDTPIVLPYGYQADLERLRAVS